VLTQKQTDILRRRACQTPKLRRPAVVVCFFLSLAATSGQQAGGGATTNQPGNQPVYTNAPSFLPPGLTNALQPTNGFESPDSMVYQIGPTPTPPLILGPQKLGSEQPAVPLVGTSVLAVPPAAAQAIPLGHGIPVWGPIDVHPSASYTLQAGSGIEDQPGQQRSLIVQTVSGGLLFDVGPQWKLNYSPSYMIYANSAFRDTLDQSVALSGGARYEDWSFNLSQAYAKTDDPLIETGTQTSQETYSTALGAAYSMSSRLSLQFGASQVLRETTQFNNINSWTGTTGMNYLLTPRLGAGLSVAAGYDSVSGSSSLPFESYEASLNFRPGSKLALNLSGGVEEMQFVNPSAPTLVNPIFSASLTYLPLPDTAVSIGASRATSPSYFGNQVIVETTISGSIRQQFSKKFSLTLNAGYSTEPQTQIVPAPLLKYKYYFGTPPTGTSYLTQDESQSATSFSATLAYAFTTHGSFSVFYSVADTSSGQGSYAYSSTQYGFTVGYSF